MFAHQSSVMAHKLVEQTKVGPKTKTATSLPLTFLDLPLAGPIYVKRQFFYQFPYSTQHFIETTLPTLKSSLSLTLQHFYPLAGNLLCPPPPQNPFIQCTHDDSVTLTVIESELDFNHLSSNDPKSRKDLDQLVPKLTYTTMDDDDDTLIFPLVALQASIFPKHGLCIAITYCHVMDDNCCSHFMKYWSSIHRTGEIDNLTLPIFDREVLKDLRGLEAVFLRDYFEERKSWKDKLIAVHTQTTNQRVGEDEDFVKATIVFGKEEIEGLKKWVLNQWKENDEFESNNAPQYLSKFVLTCGLVWAGLVKTRKDDAQEDDQIKEEYFRFAGDCRDRLGYTIPEGYFGNCLTLCHATLKRKELKGEDGFLNAVKVIHRAVTEMKSEPLKDAEDWRASFTKMNKFGSVLLVTGSPNFTVYETDFGFGRPTKVEMVHSFRCMSIAESGDMEGGGIEVGLVFKRGEFEHFDSDIKQRLEAFKS